MIDAWVRNAEFMYPEMPWKAISAEAKLCIQHFLVVKHDDREPNQTNPYQTRSSHSWSGAGIN